MFDAEPAATPAPGWTAVTHLDRDVGRVTSLAWVPEAGVAGGGMWIGLALVRREVLPGTAVRAAGRDAHVVELPFALPVNEPARTRSHKRKTRAPARASLFPTAALRPPLGARRRRRLHH